MLTAGHCVHTGRRPIRVDQIRFAPDAQDTNPAPFGDYTDPGGANNCWTTLVSLKREGGDRDVKHDWAILDFTMCDATDNPTLQDEPGTTLGFFGMGASRNQIKNTFYFAYGIPAVDCPPGGCMEPSIHGIGSNWGGLRRNHEIKHRTDTSGGQSGSGIYIFVGNQRRTVGIHKGHNWDLFHGGSYNHGRRVDNVMVILANFVRSLNLTLVSP